MHGSTAQSLMQSVQVPDRHLVQTNGSDGGYFAVQYAEHVSRNAAFGFDQHDMPYLRLKTAADIMSLDIL